MRYGYLYQPASAIGLKDVGQFIPYELDTYNTRYFYAYTILDLIFFSKLVPNSVQINHGTKPVHFFLLSGATRLQQSSQILEEADKAKAREALIESPGMEELLKMIGSSSEDEPDKPDVSHQLV